VTTGRKIFWLAILLAGLVGVIGYYWLFAPEGEPVYQGRKLSEWAADVWMHYDHYDPAGGPPQLRTYGEGVAAIRGLGDECLPLAVKWLSPDPAAAFKEKALDLAENLSSKLGWFDFPAIHYNPEETREHSLKIFATLGTNAIPAIPQLARLMESTNEEEAWPAADALSFIGPAALPTFLNALLSTNRTTVQIAIRALAALNTNAAAATPTLLRFLRSNHLGLADDAAFALVSINPDPAPVLPALLERLETTRANPSQMTLFAISRYGTNANAAAPILVGTIKSRASILDCAFAIQALGKIDPKLGTNYSSQLQAAREARIRAMELTTPAYYELPPEIDAPLTNPPSPLPPP
jgi:hypothetical protein